MMKDAQKVIDYLLSAVSDPFPRYILKKEILRETPTAADREEIYASKWYLQLAEEQWDNGSWGRFHTQNTKATVKQKFVTTEHALNRARDLSLNKEDAVVQKAIGLMERYLRGEERWMDNIEYHGQPKTPENACGWDVGFKILIAARLSIFDSINPLLRTYREICVQKLSTAFTGDIPEEDFCSIWLLQNNDFLREDLQRKYLSWIWNRKGGIQYVTNIPPWDKRSLEDKGFIQWFTGLENVSDFSLFPEMMNKGISTHLLNEINRLMTDDIKLPAAPPIVGHYCESWAGGTARKNDMFLRILRMLIKSNDEGY